MASRIGFVPSRWPSPDSVMRIPVSANGTDTIAKGDAVVRVTGTGIRASAGQDPTNGKGFGVVLAVYTTAGRPLTFQNTKFITSAQPGMADVCWSPTQTYYVQCVTSVGLSDIGKNVTVDVSSANASLGLSSMSVSIPASASANDYFKIINFGPPDSLGGFNTGGGTNNGVEVQWNNHFLRSAVAAQ